MRLALISPKGPMYRYKGGAFKKSLRYQPLTLTTLAALVPPELGLEIKLYDEGIEALPQEIEADLIGLTLITGNAKRAYQLADAFRAAGKTVILGGPHVTLMPQEAAAHADAVCLGYAEHSWPRLLRDYKEGRLQPVYRQEADFAFPDPMPFPRRDLLPAKAYFSQAVFEATRACPHDCEFCVSPTAWGRRQYQKPVAWILEDIRRVGARHNLFVDLNLVADRAYAEELFTGLAGLGIRWYGLATVLIAHDEALMELMAKSGCRGLLLGLESLSRSSLKDTNKSFNSSVDYVKLIADLHRLKIMIQGCFVFGLDSDGPDIFEETVAFAIDNGVDLPRYAVLTPFPATPLHQRLQAENRILSSDWELYDAQHVVFQPKHMSPAQLEAGHQKAWRETYKCGAIIKRLWNSGRFAPMVAAANWGYRFYARHLNDFYNCDWNRA